MDIVSLFGVLFCNSFLEWWVLLAGPSLNPEPPSGGLWFRVVWRREGAAMLAGSETERSLIWTGTAPPLDSGTLIWVLIPRFWILGLHLDPGSSFA